MLRTSWKAIFTQPRAQPKPMIRCIGPVEVLEDRIAPATFIVTNRLDGNVPGLSLREAISLANARPGTDTIFLPAGFMRITVPGTGENGNVTGDFDITDDVVIAGKSRTASVISANGLDRVFDVLGGVDVIFKNLAIRDGNAPGDGGGVQMAFDNSTLVFSSVTLLSNRAAQNGGGLALTKNASATILNSVINLNVAGTLGGGIFARDPAVDLNIQKTAIAANTAAFGAGVHFNARFFTLGRSTVDHNTATADGGGVWVRASADPTTGGTATFANSTISTNSAGNRGGGIFIENDAVNTPAPNYVVDSSTIAFNAANVGGGIFNNDAADDVAVRNTIIAPNTALNLRDVAGNFLSFGFNLVGVDDTAVGAFRNDGTSLTGTPGAPLDPLLSPLGFWAGTTKTHFLQFGSPAIDRGSTVATFDQRGLLRPFGGVADIGAFEKQPVFCCC